MKKILITSNTSWFIYNFLSPTIKELIKENYEIYALAPLDKYSILLEQLGCKYSELKLDRYSFNLIAELKVIKQIFYFLKQIQPSCVLNFTIKLNVYSVRLCKLLKIPVINSVAGVGYVGQTGIKPAIGKLLLRLTQPFANHIIFQNNDDYLFYLNHSFIKACNTSHINGIGIDLNKFTPQIALDDDCVRFILCSRMLKTKGVEDFVNAAKIVSEYFEKLYLKEHKFYKVQFALLGFIDTTNPDRIDKKALGFWHTGTVVRYLGMTDDVMSIIKDYDCVVLPSYYREGIPQSLIEACAMAKPIITTDNVGCKEAVIDQVTGYLVPPKNINKLADAMIKMSLLSHTQRLKMGMLGRRKAEKEFCYLTVAAHYKALIKSIIENYGIEKIQPSYFP